jgi:hypothetical protein
MAWIQQWAGDGLIGSSCSETPNPVINFGLPFGHPHESDIIDLLQNCQCSIYGEKYTFNVNDIPDPAARICCHELPFIYFRWNLDGYDGQLIREEYIWRQGDYEVMHWLWEWVYDDSYPYYHGYMFIGWTPCADWPGGDWYSPAYNQMHGWPEIYKNGDYTHEIKLSVVSSEAVIKSNTLNFSITGLNHTTIYGDITDNHTGIPIEGNIGIEAKESGGYNTICGNLNNEEYKTKYHDNGYVIACDGFYDIVKLSIHKSGYEAILDTTVFGVTQANLTEFDITMTPSIRGMIKDGSNGNVPLSNAYVWAENYDKARAYSTSTDVNGNFSIPIHTPGTYQIKATKNNYTTITIASYTQYGEEPTDCVNYWGYLTRISNYPVGEYAMTDDYICSNNRATIVLDEPTMGTGDLILPATVGSSIIKTKTRSWQSTLATSTGTGATGMSAGMGGSGGYGNMGAAEDWDCNWKEPGYVIHDVHLCSGISAQKPSCTYPWGPTVKVFPEDVCDYGNRYIEDSYHITLDEYAHYVGGIMHWTFIVYDVGNWHIPTEVAIGETVLFNGIERKLIWAYHDLCDYDPPPYCENYSYFYTKAILEWRIPI